MDSIVIISQFRMLMFKLKFLLYTLLILGVFSTDPFKKDPWFPINTDIQNKISEHYAGKYKGI